MHLFVDVAVPIVVAVNLYVYISYFIGEHKDSLYVGQLTIMYIIISKLYRLTPTADRITTVHRQ